MKLITRKTQASGAAERWHLQYPEKDEQRNRIYLELIDLGPNPDPNAVDDVIGNGSWTNTSRCSECNKKNSPVISFDIGDDRFYGRVYCCHECLQKAVNLIRKGDENETDH